MVSNCLYTGVQPGNKAVLPAFRGLAVLSALLIGTAAVAQVVLPDGGTSTGFTLAPDGKITVDLAPANGAGISHNTYTNFSVATAGVDLDNTAVGAGTIINEVTSANLSYLEGALTVIGPQGHVIIANPNGINVDGGKFITTGQVGLTTGTISFDGAGQPLATIGGGGIEVGPGALGGTMAGLDLIAKSIRINGGIAFDPGAPAGSINLLAGDRVVSFDEARANGGVLPWAMTENFGAGAGDAVLVDITRGGSLDGGRISIAVSDQGAGVRFAGNALASVGGFKLTSSGELVIDGGAIRAEQSVNIKAGSVAFQQEAANSIQAIDGGVVVEATDGDLTLANTTLSGERIASDNLASAGAITLIANGNISASGTLGAQVVFDAGSSHLAAFADAALDFAGVEATAGGGLRFSVGGRADFDQFGGLAGEDFFLLAGSEATFGATVVEAEGSIRLSATTLQFGSLDPEEVRTTFTSNGSGLIADATAGDLVNNGGLLQGAFAIPGNASSFGGVSLYASGDVVNRSVSLERLAVAFGQSDPLFVSAGGDIINLTGRLFSNASITLTAIGDIRNETMFDGDLEPFSVNAGRGGRSLATLFLLRNRVLRANADYGDLSIEGERALILGVGALNLTASNLINVAGEITGIDIKISASEMVENASRLVGTLDYKRSCSLLCKVSGSSSLRTVVALINASGELEIDAGRSITSTAGQLIGNEIVDLSAPITEFKPLPTLTFIERPAGLLGLFRGRFVWLSGQNDFGSAVSIAGEITIDGDAVLGDVRMVSEEDPVITGTIITSSAAEFFFSTMRGPIGLFWALF